MTGRLSGGGRRDAQRPSIRLGKPLRDSVLAGHPWLYDRALADLPHGLRAGELATVVDGRGPLATVVVDPASPIRARVLDLDPEAVVDDGWVRARARAAATARVGDPTLQATDGWRLVHGENDGLPGLTVDRYGPLLVVVFDGAGPTALWRPRLDAVWAGLRDAGLELRGAWVRGSRGRGRDGGGDPSGEALGEVPEEAVVIQEGAARFEVDVRHGGKTGFFLDQRANRATVAAHAGGATVLNLFGYTGGFSVQAALAGARHATTVDIAAPATAAARRNAERSGVAPGAHEAVAADAFAYLEEAVAARRCWDIVVVDPPSFAPSEQARPRALRAYTRLHELALAVVAPGGLLASASCSSHVHEADLLSILAASARHARRRLVVRQLAGAASDHPVLPAFPEGRYLSFALCAVT